jgi:transcription initiation factor TFIIB
MLYRNFESNYEAKGKSIACMAAATIYLACKKCLVVRSIEEIVEATGVIDKDRSNVKLASKYYRMMVMEMGLFTEPQRQQQQSQQQNPLSQGRPRNSSSSHCPASHIQPPAIALAIDHYVSKLANMAKIDTKVERLAIDIAHKTDDHLLADGKSPNGLAAAYIYIASMLLGVNILQRDMSSLAGVTEVTIRNRCKDVLTSFKLTVEVKPQHMRTSFT